MKDRRGRGCQLNEDDLRRARRAGELLERAALEPNGMRRVFSEVAELLNGGMLQLFNYTRPSAPDMIVAPENQSIIDDYLVKGWHQFDTYTHRAAPVAQHGQLTIDTQLIGIKERERDPFYQEFCRTWNIGHFTSWTFAIGGEKWAYTLMPRPGALATGLDPDAMRLFFRSADRATMIATTMQETRARGIADGIERSGRAALILDHQGRVVFATPSAEEMMGRGFAVVRRQLRSEDSSTSAAIRNLVDCAGLSRPPILVNFLIRRNDGGRPILAMPFSVRDWGMSGVPGARIILMLTDFEKTLKPTAASLKLAFDLSPREAELVRHLAGGQSLDQAAAVLGITVNTARQMLKSIFTKTHTRRQAELVALVRGM